jgi:hypothetical protein
MLNKFTNDTFVICQYTLRVAPKRMTRRMSDVSNPFKSAYVKQLIYGHIHASVTGISIIIKDEIYW